MDWVLLLGRLLFSAVFIWSGLAFHLGQRAAATGYARTKGAPWPELTVPLTGVATSPRSSSLRSS